MAKILDLVKLQKEARQANMSLTVESDGRLKLKQVVPEGRYARVEVFVLYERQARRFDYTDAGLQECAAIIHGEKSLSHS